MSYCRWSSMGFMCDLYLYEAECGWQLHIASNRMINPNPYPEFDFENITQEAVDEWNSAKEKWHKDCVTEKIELPHAGERYNFDSPGECAEFLKELKTLGYVFPETIIGILEDEQKELE